MQRKLYDLAYESKQLSAGVSAAKEISILTGHRIEKSEIGGPGEFDHFTDEELDRTLIERFIELYGPRLRITDGSMTLDGRALPSPSDDDH
jgi:hypothetical protein